MLLFQKRFHQGLRDGSIRLTFRQWPQPRVKPGGRYRVHPLGVVEVSAIARIRVGDISEDDARAAGFANRAELVEYMKPVAKEPLTDQSEIYRVELAYAGDGDRVSVAMNAELTPEDIAAIAKRLQRFDGRKPWTEQTLKLIRKHPRVAASKLADKLGRERLSFKADVVKLKKLGLTQSFEVGYELSPRGQAFLAKKPRRKPSKKKSR